MDRIVVELVVDVLRADPFIVDLVVPCMIIIVDMVELELKRVGKILTAIILLLIDPLLDLLIGHAFEPVDIVRNLIVDSFGTLAIL